MANWVGCTNLLCPLDGLLTQGGDNVVDSKDLGQGGMVSLVLQQSEIRRSYGGMISPMDKKPSRDKLHLQLHEPGVESNLNTSNGSVYGPDAQTAP